MIGIRSAPNQVNSRQVSNLLSYLHLTGWRQNQNGHRWKEYLGYADADGEPLSLVFPGDGNAFDMGNYFVKAIDLLSALSGESVEMTKRRIDYVDCDVLTVKNLETGDYDSIALPLADTQITGLKQLVTFGLRTERSPILFIKIPGGANPRALDNFRFGHTVKGSFGFTVQASINREADLFRRDQLALFDPSDHVDILISPIERRVMERIARGLIATRKAILTRNIDILVKNYAGGFNANMCDTIDAIGNERPIEYDILWSPRFSKAADVEEFVPTILHETGYTFLRQASIAMKEQEPPRPELIHGLVTHVGSEVAPLGDDEDGRQVVIRWQRDLLNSRTTRILVPLSRTDYLLAYDAHKNWNTVEVTGIPERVGPTWRLLSPRDFKILN